MRNKRHLIVNLPDGMVGIMDTGEEDDSPNTPYILAKTCFELSRPQLTHPTLVGEDLEDWRKTVHFEDYEGDLPIGCREIDVSDIPTDMTFRRAWEDSGTGIKISMAKARLIHMDNIRKARKPRLEALDIEVNKARDAGNDTLARELSTQRQALRDIPQTFSLSGAKTPAQLKALWPAELA